MSITFDIPRTRPEPTPCPNCGAVYGRTFGSRSCEYTPEGGFPCYGTGSCPPDTGLNVANGSAAIILYGLLGYTRSEVDPYYGSLDAADVVRRLATAEGRISSFVQPARALRGVYVDENGVGPGALVLEVAYDLGRLMRYVAALRELAEEAIAAGEQIHYS